MKPIEVLLAVAGCGGKLGIVGDKLRMLLPANSPPELKKAIRQHKSGLFDLLGLNFLVVRSDTLNATVFWTPDEVTKESLAAAGADPGSIYTAAELEQLVNSRVKAEDLPLIHAAKQHFAGKVTVVSGSEIVAPWSSCRYHGLETNR
jgi:hypothetical protein